MACEDFLEFEDYLKKSRNVDDKLIYMLNASLPTESFKSDASHKCKELYEKFESNYTVRGSSIKQCIAQSADKVKQLKSKQISDPDDIGVLKSLKKEQNKVRLLQTELGVEEILKNRSNKLFYERCRSYFKPDNLAL